MPTVQTLTVQFPDITLAPELIKDFRGEVIARTPEPDDRLHNHTPDGASIYRYPMVQYRVWQGRATLFGIGEGIPAVKAFLDTLDQTPYQATPARTEVSLTDVPVRYAIGQWWPLNTDNLRRWDDTTGLANRVRLLEGILVNQLLAVCSAVGYQVPNRGLQVEIEELTEQPARQFDTQSSIEEIPAKVVGVIYSANLRLPDGIGVGKGVSKGFGVQMPVGPGWHLHRRDKTTRQPPRRVQNRKNED